MTKKGCLMAKNDQAPFVASDSIVRILQQNPGLAFGPADFQDMQMGVLLPTDIAFRPPGGDLKDYGCITELRYDSDTKLVQVTFDSGARLNSSNVSNLSDFREIFQMAANFGHGITSCYNTRTKKLSMVNLIPCRCQCDKKD